MNKQEKGFSRRQMLEMTVGLSGLAMMSRAASLFAQEAKQMPTRMINDPNTASGFVTWQNSNSSTVNQEVHHEENPFVRAIPLHVARSMCT